MDLSFHGPQATAVERAAVDSILGPPTSDRPGGARDPDAEGRGGFLPGHAARSRRDLLLPALHAVQSRFGWVPPGALDYICRRLTVPPAEAHGVVTFYHLLSVEPQPPAVAHVCDDIACRIRGADRLRAGLEHALGPEGAGGWKASPCLGHCELAPAALVLNAGESPRAASVAPATVAGILGELASQGEAGDDFESLRRSVPQFGAEGLRLLGRVGRIDPGRIDAYRESGGYQALARAIEIGRDRVIDEVLASKLMGRGGAAFPTGRKWQAVARAPARPHYLVCNADESEPGTFKDRVLMEGDPFAVIEGMTIAGFATGCERGYLYVRGEYPRAARRLEAAIAAARSAGLLGPDVMDAGFAFDIELRRGAGAYICGEETALFNSIEGRRGEPRNKPPFPVQAGLFGKPTLVNNVETLVNIPLILALGGAAYAAIGTAGSTGPKLFCVSGRVARPGVYEVEFGITLGDLIASAGGIPDGRSLRAVLLGGAAGTFIGPDRLATPLTLEGTRGAGAVLGSGAVLVLDETIDVGDILARIAAFFRDESCGQCVPCRVGTVRQEELVQRLRSGRPIGSREDEMSLLAEIGQVMRDASICGLGQAASNAIESAFATLGPRPEREPTR
ncbi:NAD(P)H-dependent oxidoreductase subunit E [Aquisphaera insulae]|uniref:NAD(P)H-dependent oxidoreductase subunit E n=1 Tax=Aquisphaera insulae TaxID=2712864 RepID=UPI0013EAE6E9|nr:NAD(P)H-dependent oxidoreductase subunit E [Aquisphaera insulae]